MSSFASGNFFYIVEVAPMAHSLLSDLPMHNLVRVQLPNYSIFDSINRMLEQSSNLFDCYSGWHVLCLTVVPQCCLSVTARPVIEGVRYTCCEIIE
jgi:hypothetical protein